MNKINILGITIKDYTLKEALKNADRYMKSGALNTIGYISSKLLIAAANGSDTWKEWLEAFDMTVCTDADILCAGEEISKSRIREIEENSFLIEFLKKAAKEKRSIYLLADTEERLERLETGLRQMQDNLNMAGKSVLPYVEDIDGFINEVNGIVPDVIISRIPSPTQERLIHENKNRINAGVWLALLEENKIGTRRDPRSGRIMGYIYARLFRKKVEKYHNEEDRADV